MHALRELPPWERLLKSILWEQLGNMQGKRILDFGSGAGITADHFAAKNQVVAIEPSEKMLENRWMDHPYQQILGDASALQAFPDHAFDVILCHNVLEYVEDKEPILRELSRLLQGGGRLSIVKHNRPGRVMQMAVLLDDLESANDLLDGKDGMTSQFGPIRYYDDEMITSVCPSLKLIKTLGIRTFWDLQQKQEKHGTDAWQAEMRQLEMRVADIEAYRSIAFFHHLLFTKEALSSWSGRYKKDENIPFF